MANLVEADIGIRFSAKQLFEGLVDAHRISPNERSIRGQLELHADGVVAGGGVGPFGVGGELDFHALGDGRFEQVVAAAPQLAGGALASALVGLRSFIGVERVEQLLAFGGGDFGEFIGGGFLVNGEGVLLQDGAADGDVFADAVVLQDAGVFGVMLQAGTSLDEVDDFLQLILGVDFLLGEEHFFSGGADGFAAVVPHGVAVGQGGGDFRFGDVVFVGFLAGFGLGDELREVGGNESDAADFLSFGERGELGLVQRRRGGAGFRCRSGRWSWGVGHGIDGLAGCCDGLVVGTKKVV